MDKMSQQNAVGLLESQWLNCVVILIPWRFGLKLMDYSRLCYSSLGLDNLNIYESSHENNIAFRCVHI